MGILHRYILREILLFSLICLFAFTGIFLTIQILKTSSLVVSKGVDSSQVGMIFLAIIPTFLQLAIPLSALLGVMLAFARLSGDSEIIVIRASGMSLQQLLPSVVLFGCIMLGLSYLVSRELKPWGYRTLGQTLFEIARSKSTAGLEPGFFSELGELTIYTEQIDYQTGELSNVLIHDRRSIETYRVIFAKRGFLSTNREEESIRFLLYDGSIHEQFEKEYELTQFESQTVRIGLDELFPEQDSRERRTRELSRRELLNEIEQTQLLVTRSEFKNEEIKRKTEQKLRSLKVERESRSATPFAALFLALMAMPLGIQPPRAQKTFGAGLSLIIGLIAFLLYYGSLSIGIAMAESGSLSPFIAVWLPNVLTGTLAIIGINGMSSERWQSIGHALVDSAQLFKTLFRTLQASVMRRFGAAT